MKGFYFRVFLKLFISIPFFLNSGAKGFCLAPSSTTSSHSKNKTVSFLLKEIHEQLPEIARAIIRMNPYYEKGYRGAFLADPDALEFHQPKWHRYGILSHSRDFLDFYEQKLPEALSAMKLPQRIFSDLEEKIDGIPKRELLRIVALVHDLGKFSKEPEGEKTLSFIHHEKKSKEIILNPELPVCSLLSKYLTNAQIQYVAECAALHFALGVIRDRISKQKLEWNIQFLDSEAATEEFLKIIRQNETYAVEIGILFICDSASKIGDYYTPSMLEVRSDQEAQKLCDGIETANQQAIQGRATLKSPAFLSAVMTFHCAKKYFQLYYQNHALVADRAA